MKFPFISVLSKSIFGRKMGEKNKTNDKKISCLIITTGWHLITGPTIDEKMKKMDCLSRKNIV